MPKIICTIIFMGLTRMTHADPDITNWHRHVFHLQNIRNVLLISSAMSLQHRYNIRMSIRKIYFESAFVVIVNTFPVKSVTTQNCVNLSFIDLLPFREISFLFEPFLQLTEGGSCKLKTFATKPKRGTTVSSNLDKKDYWEG